MHADLRVVNLAAEDAEFHAQLNASFLTTPDGMPLVWLGRRLGHRAVGRVYGPDLMLAMGAAFDLLPGRVRQAPRWIQRSGFEWLFRLCVEPRRLAPRYLRHLPLFTLRAAAQLTGLRKYP